MFMYMWEVYVCRGVQHVGVTCGYMYMCACVVLWVFCVYMYVGVCCVMYVRAMYM